MGIKNMSSAALVGVAGAVAGIAVGCVFGGLGGMALGALFGAASAATGGGFGGAIAAYGLVVAAGGTLGGLVGSIITGAMVHKPNERGLGRSAIAAGLLTTALVATPSIYKLYNRAAARPVAMAPAPTHVATQAMRPAANADRLRLTA